MTPDRPPTDGLRAALEEYLRAREAGLAPGRDELLARHPGFARELAAALDAADAVRSGASGNSEPVPSALGEYQILGVAGRGGTGVVYEAFQIAPPRRVALKVLAQDAREDPVARRRFLTEIVVAGRLHHTHIVPVLAAVPGDNGPVAYAMPFIHGASLSAVLGVCRAAASGGHNVPPDGFDPRAQAGRSAVEWVRQSAEAVAAAHAAGVTHRDVKPANLLLEFDRGGRPHVWLHDFGLAALDNEPDDPRPAGTPGYMSPEQRAGEPGGCRPPTDVYALGATLFELLTLTRPGEAVPARAAGVPRELRRVIARATASHPADRYPSAADLADDLARYLAGYPVAAGRPAAYRTVALWAGRHRRALVAAAVGFLAAGAVGGGLLARAYALERAARQAAEDDRRAADAARGAVATYTLAIDDALYATPGLLDTQRKLLEQAAEVHRQQVDRDPTDRIAARRLAQTEWRLGRVYVQLGRRADGTERLQRSADGYAALIAAEPHQHLHRLDLARSYSVLAWATTYARPDEMARLHREALRVVRGAVADFPDDLDVRDAFASHAAEYGETLSRAGRGAEAEAVLREALEAGNHCMAAMPDRWHYASAVAGCRMRLARVAAGRGRLGDALAENAAALELVAGLLVKTAAPGGGRLDALSFRMTRADLLRERGWWLVARGEDPTAVAEELRAAAKVLATEHPDRARDESATLAGLRAWAGFRKGRVDADACRVLEAGLTPVARSRYFADGPGPREPAKALAAADEALRAAPNDADAHAARGIALYRLGRFAEAETELAGVAARPPHRSAGLVRAMVAARLERRADARRLLDEVLDSVLPLEPCHPELENEARAAVESLGR